MKPTFLYLPFSKQDDERPLDYKEQSQMYLEEHTLNSTRIVDDGIKRSEDYCQMRKNPNYYYKQ